MRFHIEELSQVTRMCLEKCFNLLVKILNCFFELCRHVQSSMLRAVIGGCFSLRSYLREKSDISNGYSFTKTGNKVKSDEHLSINYFLSMQKPYNSNICFIKFHSEISIWDFFRWLDFEFDYFNQPNNVQRTFR